MGSVMLMFCSLPARLAESRHVAAHRRLAQLHPAQAELAVVAARTAGDRAAAVLAARARVARQLLQRLDRRHALLVRSLRVADLLLDARAPGGVFLHRLGPALLAFDHAGLRHRSLPERKIERLEQGLARLVVARGRRDRDVHAAELVDLVVCDLGEDDLFLDPEAVVALAVERARVHAAEVADARHRDVDQAIQELVHARASQRHHAADRQALADLERRDRLLRLAHRRLLAGDVRELGGRRVHDLLVGHGLAHAHVDRDLGDARHLHVALQAEVRAELRLDDFAVLFLQPGCRCGHLTGLRVHASTVSPFDLKKRTLRPSFMVRTPMRPAFLVAGFSNATFEPCSDASFCTIAPVTPLPGFGRWCFLTMFTPSTSTRPSGLTATTVPVRPLSRPAVTTTESPLRILFIELPVPAK